MHLDYNLLLTLVSGLITALGATVASVIAAKLNRQKKLETEKIEDVLAVSGAKAEEARNQLALALAEKLPDGLTAEQILDKLSTQYRISGDVIVNQIVKEGGNLIGDLVNGYHQQALSQARVQFWFSVVAATLGFIYIVYSATTTSVDQTASILKILPGVVIDAVALLFFRQAEQTRQRATELYDRLRKDSQMAMAHKILESITDSQIKSLAQAQIALHLSGLTPKDIDLASLLSHVKVPA
jgi:ABC-type molybdate transport system substrate-binding protein